MSWIKKHYHWVIAVSVLLQLTVHGGLNNNLSLFTIPVSEAFGISRGTFSVATSLKSVSSFLATCFSGAVLLRFGYRKSVLGFLAVAIAGLGILSASNNIVMYSLGCVLFGLADGVCISAGPPRIVNTWFHRHQGTVLGLVTAATGLGGSLMCLVLSGVMEKAGWNVAFLCSAGFMTAVALLILLLVRDRPSALGLKPLGEGARVVKKKSGTDHWFGYTFQELLRSPVFYLMLVGTFVSCFFSGGALVVMVPHLQGRGLSAQEAAAMQSTLMLALAAVKLGYGFLTDTIGAKRVTIICLASAAVSHLLFTLVTGPTSTLLAVLVFSLSLPVISVMIPLLSNALFGYQAQATCVGIFMGMASLAGMVYGPVPNMIFDKTGSYNPFFWAGAAISVALIGLYLFMYKLADRDKKRLMAAHETQ